MDYDIPTCVCGFVAGTAGTTKKASGHGDISEKQCLLVPSQALAQPRAQHGHAFYTFTAGLRGSEPRERCSGSY